MFVISLDIYVENALKDTVLNVEMRLLKLLRIIVGLNVGKGIICFGIPVLKMTLGICAWFAGNGRFVGVLGVRTAGLMFVLMIYRELIKSFY
jgi:uncharacterized membrane protein